MIIEGNIRTARVAGVKSYYDSHRPTRPMPCLPVKIENRFANTTPASIRQQFLKDMQMKSRGWNHDNNPVLQMLNKFPKKDLSVLASVNRRIFYGKTFDWDSIGTSPQPRSVVMCPPTYFFDIKPSYEINSWMDRNMPISRSAAIAQWRILKAEIERVMPVDTIMPIKKQRDMVFVDQGLAIPSLDGGSPIFIPGIMRTEERRDEVGRVEDFFTDRGYEIRKLGPGSFKSFESNGDVQVVPGRPLLFTAYGPRTSRNVIPELGDLTGHQIVPLALAGEREHGIYHLDTTTTIIRETTALVFDRGLSPESLALFLMFFNKTYLLNTFEAGADFVPNSKMFGDRTFITETTAGESFLSFIAGEVNQVVEVDLSELNKSGGGTNCCSKLAFHAPTGKPAAQGEK